MEISVNYSRTVNLGNFESTKLEMGITKTISKIGEKEIALIKEFENLKEIVDNEILEK